ncbi:MAG: sugar phosphate isomerase/epimerase [Candidatus Latescibacterota bacterium]|jgi:sugar phosphate isomerase/epimerase
MKLGVITDGISRDFAHALNVMTEFELTYAELQFVGDTEVGDHTPEEIQQIKTLADQHNVAISCISRHNFGGLSIMEVEPESEIFQTHLAAFRRCIDMAKALGTNLVRIMSGRKEMILFGSHGAEVWNVSNGAWDRFLKLMEYPVKIAEEENVTLVVETGNNSMITSGFLGRKFIDDIGSKNLKILWDVPNSLYCADTPYPDAYELIKDHIGHIHIKDGHVNVPHATLDICPIGEGDAAPYFEDIANALRRDNYQGIISYESVYRPDGGTFEDGFRTCIPAFKKLFGDES